MRTMHWWRSMCLTSAVAVATACGTEADQPVAPSTSKVLSQRPQAAKGPTVIVTDVEELYAAVNDAANAGAVIVMAAGTYTLSVNDPGGAARPNGGRLDLQTDMSLVGVKGNRSAAVIDARDLPAAAFTVSFGRTAPVRMGRGYNVVEWLTVLGPSAAAAGIATELTGTPTTKVRVANVLLSGASRGIDVRNVGATMVGRQIDAEIVDNELVGPTDIVGLSEGIRISNFVGAHNGIILARLSGNNAHGFQFGCIVANNRSNDGSITIRSSADRFHDNNIGCMIAGGLSQTTGVALDNRTVFEAHGTRFTDNTATELGFIPAGLQVVGGFSSVTPNVTSNNVVSVKLFGTKSEDNLGENFEAYGAWTENLSGIAGTGNHVTVELRGVSKHMDVTAASSLPADPGNTNTVTIIR